MYGSTVRDSGEEFPRGSGINTVVEDEEEKRQTSTAIFRTFIVAIALLGISVMVVTAHRSFSSSMSSSKLVERTYYSSMSDSDKEVLFVEFLDKFGKSYGDSTSDEYQLRLSNFKANLLLADDRNMAEESIGGEAIHGTTKFSDLSSDEFLQTYTMTEYWTGTALADHVRRLGPSKPNLKNLRKLQDLSVTDIDWSTSITTPVVDQGSTCRGASWAYAAAHQIESDAIRKGVIASTEYLSPQQFISCVTNSSGCDSGSVESVYAYSKRPGAVYYEKDYPYTGSDSEECADTGSGYALTLGSYATVTKYHNEIEGYTTEQVESNMLAHLVETGTLHACVDATTWSTYQSGTMSMCMGTSINQCVQVVGLYYDPMSNTGYYKVRNSWGTDWGEDGYIYLAHGNNVCDITYNPGYTDPIDCC